MVFKGRTLLLIGMVILLFLNVSEGQKSKFITYEVMKRDDISCDRITGNEKNCRPGKPVNFGDIPSKQLIGRIK